MALAVSRLSGGDRALYNGGKAIAGESVMSLALAKWTVAAYHRIIAAGVLAGRRVELVAGDIVEMAPAGPLHRYISAVVRGYLQGLLGDRALVLPPGPVALPEVNSELEPDIAVVAALGAVYKTRLPRPADIYWLIEVSDSTLAYDLGKKAALYAAAGVGEYWVLAASEQCLWVHRDPANVAGADAYRNVVRYQTGMVTPLAFSDIAVDIALLFA